MQQQLLHLLALTPVLSVETVQDPQLEEVLVIAHQWQSRKRWESRSVEDVRSARLAVVAVEVEGCGDANAWNYQNCWPGPRYVPLLVSPSPLVHFIAYFYSTS
jgi:hypothetical protein